MTMVGEVSSAYGYVSGYKRPKPLEEQLILLSWLFPDVGRCNPDLSKAAGALPAGAEGWFVIPKPKLIAPSYGQACEYVLDRVNTLYKGRFVNYREGKLGPKHLRLTKRTAAAWERVGREQPGVLIVPAQLGLRHRGRSAHDACAVMDQNECGFGPFEAAITLLTHSDRLRFDLDLWVLCGGAEVRSLKEPDGAFNCTPCLDFEGGAGFGSVGTSEALPYCGCASWWSQ